MKKKKCTKHKILVGCIKNYVETVTCLRFEWQASEIEWWYKIHIFTLAPSAQNPVKYWKFCTNSQFCVCVICVCRLFCVPLHFFVVAFVGKHLVHFFSVRRCSFVPFVVVFAVWFVRFISISVLFVLFLCLSYLSARRFVHFNSFSTQNLSLHIYCGSDQYSVKIASSDKCHSLPVVVVIFSGYFLLARSTHIFLEEEYMQAFQSFEGRKTDYDCVEMSFVHIITNHEISTVQTISNIQPLQMYTQNTRK